MDKAVNSRLLYQLSYRGIGDPVISTRRAVGKIWDVPEVCVRDGVGASLAFVLLVFLAPLLLHHHPVSYVVVLHPGHEIPHQHYAPSTGGLDV